MKEDLIRVAILAPTLAMRLGLRTLLKQDEVVDVVAEVSNFGDLLEELNGIDLILIQGNIPLEDLNPPKSIGSQLAYLWMTDDPQVVENLRKIPSRAWGIIFPDSNEEELLTALNAAYMGNIVAPREMLEPLWRYRTSDKSNNLIESLTPRESEVLQLLALGLSNKQISLELEISKHTVKFHISSIYSKIGATNRTEAVRKGLGLGLVSL